MTDKVALLIDGKRVENFESYSIEADLYTADDAFSLELVNPETQVSAGNRCELTVNDTLELTGIIDRVTKGYDKSGVRLRVEGRDLMGLLVDTYAEDFVTVQGKTVKDLAELLIGKTFRHPALPFMSRGSIIYQENIVGKLKGKKRTADQPSTAFLDTPQKLSQIEPGMTVFEVLRTYAMSRGLMFYAMPDGTFVFGRPRTGGGATYQLTCRRDGYGNNVLAGERVDDISKRYSKVTVITQRQGQDADGMTAGTVNIKATKEDTTFPFYKPFVTRLNNDSQSPALHARLLLEKQRHDGFSLSYRVPGHSQDGTNWRINEICQVKDEILGVSDSYLIYGRTFERSKAGTFTRLRLGPPGVIA